MDFASPLFLNHPIATLVIDSKRSVIAGSHAAIELFERPRLGQYSSAKETVSVAAEATPPQTPHPTLTFDQLGIHLEADNECWAAILDRAKTENLSRHISFKVESRNNNNQLSHTPLQPNFSPSIFDQSVRSSEKVVRAKVDITNAEINHTLYHILAFSEVAVAENHAQDPKSDSSVENPEDQAEAIWLRRCRNAMFESTNHWQFLIEPHGHFSYLNSFARKSFGQQKLSLQWYDDIGGIWTPDFSRRLTPDEYPASTLLRTRTDLGQMVLGMINEHTGGRSHFMCWGNCLWDPATGEFLGALLDGKGLGPYEPILRKQQEDRLLSFETICDSMPHFVWTADKNGLGQWFSKQWLEFTGLEIENCQGWSWTQTIHPDDIDAFMTCFKDAHQNVRNYEIEARCRRHDGNYRWMLKRGSPIKDDTGRVIRWVSRLTFGATF